MARGLLSKPPKAEKKRKQSNEKRLYAGLNRNQTNLVKGQEKRDLALGNTADTLQDDIAKNFGQAFDWSQLPSAPVQGDFNNWRQSQMDSTFNEFMSRIQPQFDEEKANFDQMMANRGIPMGSELYNKQLQQLQQSQAQAKNNALVQAQAIAGQNAGQFFDIGTTARNNALGEGMQQRYAPLTDYQALLGAQSGYKDADLAQSFGVQNQAQDFKNQQWIIKNTPHGGGGGGGKAPIWAQYGFGSPQEYDAYQTAQDRANQQWNWQNNPQYQQPKGVNPYAQLGGSLLGAFAGGFGQSMGKGIFG